MTDSTSFDRGNKRKPRAIAHLIAVSLTLAMASNVRSQEVWERAHLAAVYPIWLSKFGSCKAWCENCRRK